MNWFIFSTNFKKCLGKKILASPEEYQFPHECILKMIVLFHSQKHQQRIKSYIALFQNSFFPSYQAQQFH